MVEQLGRLPVALSVGPELIRALGAGGVGQAAEADGRWHVRAFHV